MEEFTRHSKISEDIITKMKEDGVYLINQFQINKSYNINIFALVDYGKVNDFDFYLADQTREKVSDELTLKDIYESTKLKTLRFYGVTTAHTIHLNGNNSKERHNIEPDISAQLIHPNQSDLGQKSPHVQAEDNIRAITSVSTIELQIPDSNQAENMMGLEESNTSFKNTCHGDCFEKKTIFIILAPMIICL
ncbi:hypothetical protein ACJMK2_043533 [Sinanodonta woodiana]|uniref:Uncharacterized protein n=1 Tax=Sinanodonta woodiana TaxID=1069815 RepID=A0ABD3VX63_SINWO